MAAALGWGALAASSLVIGAWLALVREWPGWLVGLVLSFGAGALIAAVSYELAQESFDLGDQGITALGLAAGALYAAGDTATKAVFPGGAHLVLIPAVLCLHGLAFVALQLGFQRGSPLETAGTATLLTNALPIAAGTILYGESLGSGIFALFRLLAFASVVAGAAALSLGGAGRTDARDVPRGTAAETSVSDTAVRRRTPAGLSSGCA